jgi:drug/metabolite transporter (DMT)-like permease
MSRDSVRWTTPSRAGVLRLAVLALLWGSGFLCIKLALRGFDPAQIVFGRLLLGFATLLPIALWRRMPFPRDRVVWGHLVFTALISNAIPYLLFAMAEETVDSNIAGVINATVPLWTLLLGVLVGLDRTVTVRRATGFGLGFLGVVVMFAPWESAGDIAGWGGLACLAAAASYGISFLYMGRYLTNRGIPPLMLSVGQLAAATVLTLAVIPVAGMHPIDWRWDAVISLVLLGVLATGLAYVLSYRIIEDEGPVVASTVTYLLPIVAVALGWVVLREPVTVTIIGGMALVLAGVALTRRNHAVVGLV